MDKELRKKKLTEIEGSADAYMTGIRIPYQGEPMTCKAFKIPLEYLIYNKYNGRIGSRVKSYEKQFKPLNAENSDDIKLIEKFLWDLKPDRNKSTEDSLVSLQQQKYGIVTRDGTIIDGNRRAMLLNKIYREREYWEKHGHNVNHAKYFIAVILPKDDDPKEIMKLETTYQMGEDKKLDYDPIEKYLKCKDLEAADFEPWDIAPMMGEEESTVIEWIEIMKLMDDYLNYLGYTGIYTRLVKREGQFVDLVKYLRAYKKGAKSAEWGYEDSDITDLKSVCFDYIRAQYEGKDFRYIARPKKDEGIFCKEELWKKFLGEHIGKIESIQEPTVEEMQKANPESDLSTLLEARDADWLSKADAPLKKNINISINQLSDFKAANQPRELLEKARNTLNSINTGVEAFFNDEKVYELIAEINRICWEYKKTIEKAQKAK